MHARALGVAVAIALAINVRMRTTNNHDNTAAGKGKREAHGIAVSNAKKRHDPVVRRERQRGRVWSNWPNARY